MENFPQLSLKNVPYYKENEYWFPHFNRLSNCLAELPKSCKVHDVTLRDGEQAPGVTFLEDERVRIAELLDEIGVYRIEGGMPAVSDVQYNALKRIAHSGLKAKIFGFARAVEKDIRLTIDAGCEGVVIEHTVNPLFCKVGYGLTPKETVDRMVKSLSFAKKADLYTTFMGWDWFRAPIEWTKWLVENILNEVEFDGLTIVDTQGNATPEAVYYVIKSFKTWFPKLSLEFHGHNDMSMGVASSMAAMKAGADVIHTAMNSLGERSGNVATEQLLVAAQHYYGVDMGANLKAIYPSAITISKFAKSPISPIQPVLGERAYQVENGVLTHLTYALKNAGAVSPTSTYPSVIGKPGGIQIILGKNSGKNSVSIALEKNGLTATDEQIDALADLIKNEGILTKDLVSNDQFLAMYQKVVG